MRALRKHVKKSCKGKKQGEIKQIEASTVVFNDIDVDKNEKVNAREKTSPKRKENGEAGLSVKLPNKVQKKKKNPKSTKILNCQECHKSYESPGGLRKHMKTHNKAFR